MRVTLFSFISFFVFFLVGATDKEMKYMKSIKLSFKAYYVTNVLDFKRKESVKYFILSLPICCIKNETICDPF